MEISQFVIQKKCLQLIGLQRDELTNFPKIFNFVQLLNISSMIFCVQSEIFFISVNFSNILATAEALTPISLEIITITKIITFWVSKQKFYQLMDRIKKLSDEGE